MADAQAEGQQSVQVAEVVARFLTEHGVDRVFGLQGGHIQPIWDQLARRGVRIVDVRDEGSAVHMAHAHTELTGQTAVALVTAGPGVTNTVTAVANASVSRIPLLVIGGCPPIPQSNMGPLQDIPHTAILEPVTRVSRTLRSADQVLREFDEAWARASGDRGEPGPVYLEIPTDVLRREVPPALVLDEHLRAKPKRRPQPHPDDVAAVAALIRAASRPAVISGRGARTTDGTELVRLLDASGAAYLDTQESRGLVPDAHPAAVGSARSAVMRDTDLLITVGRQLDYQLGMGSPAVFRHAKIVRIADTASELIDNRRGEVEILAEPGAALGAIADALKDHAPDTAWRDELKAKHRKRAEDYRQALHTTENGADGHIHPNRIFGALDALDGDALDLGETIMIADGGDLLSFARLGITRCARYLDVGAFGCLGVATPFGIAASLAYPERPVVAVTGDGAFGITATEVDTAVRHGAKVVVIVSNNRAWNIERYDQAENYGLVAGTELGDADFAAMARAFGAYGVRVTDPADLADAIRGALEHAPAVVDVVTSQDAPSPDSGKGLGFVPDYQALTPWNDAEVERRKGEQS
ncbi:thiamine pyrophosphate-binding protein [Actinomycetospora sp. TBRC 11914]|uniref:thiamine pyrophosphate-binding protein n=1 Tax=Actinomycetospora sp. TBRC 11914 TaxID=2729387 RepID=UPI00145EB2D7|nr:thiamine pyrophosphate-binding protein [Actinomycetospora sp. TBRC 11914]NMO93039.1 thiamine pyrophosphate-binding protein [Actinomycetospora sp. TBRC 11914]